MRAHISIRPSATMATVLALAALVLAGIAAATSIMGARASVEGAAPPTVTEVQETADIKKWGVAKVTAQCPDKFPAVISGGYLNTSPYTVAVHDNPTTVGDGWTVVAVNPVGLPAKASKVTVFAICTKADTPVVY